MKCEHCGREMLYLAGENYWACMDLGHGRLVRPNPRSQAPSAGIEVRNAASVGASIRRGAKALNRLA
jgi:DNA-directed RNA polymerase subunit RPC12/RpoP